MAHLVLFGFLVAYVLQYFSVKQANEEDFKKWALPLSAFSTVVMALINITAFFFLPAIILIFPLHIIAIVIGVNNSKICVDCGKWIDKDTD